MTDEFVCIRCGNKDKKFIGIRNGKEYCRLCLSFNGKEVNYCESYSKNATLTIDYALTKDQKRISDSLLENYISHKNSLVYAVCGSGKTELVYKTIAYVLRCGGKVGFAIPRREVVIELYERLSSAFKKVKMQCVYGGHNDVLEGDFIILTTHQLYRYPKYFDLLILDEIDAFPFKGNDVLKSFFKKSIKGQYILMSATPSKEILNKFKNDKDKSLLTLMKRYHGGLLPIPIIKVKSDVLAFFEIVNRVRRYIKDNKRVFIFCPTIALCRYFYFGISLFLKNGNYVHSKKNQKERIISDFKENKYRYLVTTSVLERGVTVENLQVIVFKADHELFSCAQLVQIAGRVGRKKQYTEGDVFFYGKEKSEEMVSAIREIEDANKNM